MHGWGKAGGLVRPVLLFAVALLGSGCALQQFLRMEEVSLGERLQAQLGGGGNSVVLFHGTDALLVDVKVGDFARRLRREVTVEHQHHVRRIVLTHSHRDHVGGLSLYPDTEVVMVHPATRARLTEAGVRARWVEISREAALVLGNEEVRVIHPGVAHSDGDLVVHFPNRRLLVAGDLFVADSLPYVDGRAGGNLLAYGRTLDRVLTLDFDEVVPGHGPLAPRAKLELLRAYLAALEQQTREARARGLTALQAEEAVKVSGFDGLRNVLVGVDRKRNVREMYQALAEEKVTR